MGSNCIHLVLNSAFLDRLSYLGAERVSRLRPVHLVQRRIPILVFLKRGKQALTRADLTQFGHHLEVLLVDAQDCAFPLVEVRVGDRLQADVALFGDLEDPATANLGFLGDERSP